ncbi:MAG TPA: tetratricopeptide repeat protein [Pyrinomonadaceae bacterium]|jgi:tetratricopeptide (TPR) repeat protein
MRIIKYISALCLLLLFFVCSATHTQTVSAQRRRSNNVTGSSSSTTSVGSSAAISGEQGEQAQLKAILGLPPRERIEKLKSFVEAHPRSPLKDRALELIVSARAALGDELLKAGDPTGGREQFRRAVTESSVNMSEKLYTEVVSTLPLNLFLRGERAAAVEVARLIEEKVKENPKRLLAVAAFYLNIEEIAEATRIAELAVKLAPDMAAAHQVLGSAHHIALRLDEAGKEYARALELDPALATARRSLADLRRAGGQPEQALMLYQEQLKADPADKAARAGVALALFDLGKREEAERELEAALKDDPRNFQLLTGAAYWYAAHEAGARALELAEQAVQVEPRYTWAQISLGRALLMQGRPLDAERVLRFARQYGRFPTLDYELASALAAAGLYEEAATELARSFTLKDGQIETQLAGRTPAHATSFTELLALERRASIFQPATADTENNARVLKNLLAFYSVLSPAGGGGEAAISETQAVASAQEFASGEDKMRAYRQLYAASRLLQNRIAFQTVIDLTQAAINGVEAALDAPAATVATMADNLIDIRARAIATGATPAIPDVQRYTLSNILRGRIEDMIGTALFNQDKATEAVVHLRRAVSVLPEDTIWLRTALWHLGTALEATGNQQEALIAYIRSYRSGATDAARRSVIETLYRKVNGSLNGLEDALGVPASASSSTSTNTSASAVTPESARPAKDDDSSATTTTTAPAASPETSSNNQAAALPAETPTPTPAPASSAVADSVQTQTLEQTPAAATTPTSAPAPPAPEVTPAPEQTGTEDSTCLIQVSEDTLTVRNNGGSTIITVTLMGWGGAGDVTATTTNWPDIAIFPEPKSGSAPGTFKYSITSVSRNVGTYYITLKSPCGEKLLEVRVT